MWKKKTPIQCEDIMNWASEKLRETGMQDHLLDLRYYYQTLIFTLHGTKEPYKVLKRVPLEINGHLYENREQIEGIHEKLLKNVKKNRLPK